MPGVDAHAMEGVDGVRRGVVHPGAGVEDQHAVADPGRLAGDHLVDRERERRPGRSCGPAGRRPRRTPARAARAGGRPRAPTPGSAGPPAGPASAPGCTPAGRARSGSGWRPRPRPRCRAARPGPAGDGPGLRRPARPGPRGAASGWWSAAPGPAPRTRSSRPPGGHEEQQVGEAQVGQHPPAGHQALQVVDDRVAPGRCAPATSSASVATQPALHPTPRSARRGGAGRAGRECRPRTPGRGRDHVGPDLELVALGGLAAGHDREVAGSSPRSRPAPG